MKPHLTPAVVPWNRMTVVSASADPSNDGSALVKVGARLAEVGSSRLFMAAFPDQRGLPWPQLL